jgi:hypothetical protein
LLGVKEQCEVCPVHVPVLFALPVTELICTKLELTANSNAVAPVPVCNTVSGVTQVPVIAPMKGTVFS